MSFCFSRPLPVFCLCFLFDVLHCAEAEMVPHGDLICTCWWCRMLSTSVHTSWWFTGLALRNINSGFLMFGYWVFDLHIYFGYKPLPRQMLYYSVLNKLGYTSQSGLCFHKEWLKASLSISTSSLPNQISLISWILNPDIYVLVISNTLHLLSRKNNCRYLFACK